MEGSDLGVKELKAFAWRPNVIEMRLPTECLSNYGLQSHSLLSTDFSWKVFVKLISSMLAEISAINHLSHVL